MKRKLKIIIIDGQGGKMGKLLVEQIKAAFPSQELYSIGTNSTATATMLKAGADYGATGENPIVVNSKNADIIIGPVGIVIADSLLGEVTHAMAYAVGSSSAHKILLPVNRCNHFIVGIKAFSLAEQINDLIEYLKQYITTIL